MTLYDLKIGEEGIITKVKGRGAFRKRIIEMGFIAGKKVKLVKRAPLGDPAEYQIIDYYVSIRNEEAKLIEIVSESEIKLDEKGHFNGMIDEHRLKTRAKKKIKNIHIAFVGNPNSGKTTIFNHASGSHERVSNYGGVTIESKVAEFKLDGYTFKVVDLPGTYSLSAYSPEELYVREYIFEHSPDVIVNIIDASNIERNLYLTTQLIDMDIKVVAALNMFDELQRKGDDFDYEHLGQMTGVPFIPTIGKKRKGIKKLLRKVIEAYEDREETIRHIHINYGVHIEESIKKLQKVLLNEGNELLTSKFAPRFISIKLIEGDAFMKKSVSNLRNADEIFAVADKEINILESLSTDDAETQITNAKYAFIGGALKETYIPNEKRIERKSEKIDKIMTHKWLGLPLFVFIMWAIFFFTFTIGQYPMDWIQAGVDFLSEIVGKNLQDGIVKSLLTDAIIGGVGGVLVFLPNIMFLYLFIALMQDTGYMARAVFVMDKVMHKVGLHGKSFIPLIMGFGCNVPAILSTRIIQSRRDRLITMLINPFMSCGARLPVYILFITAFFDNNRANMLFLMYSIGVFLAMASAWILSHTVFREQDAPFVMELPPYRAPTIKSLLKQMWSSAEQYLKKIAGIVLMASLIIWALSYFPHNKDIVQKYDTMISAAPTEQDTASLVLQKKAAMQEDSYIGRIGKTIQPIMAPLGFDWKMTVGIIVGVAAKEVVISTLGVLYLSNDEDVENTASLVEKLQQQTTIDEAGNEIKLITPLLAFVYMLFILIYFPCIAVIVAIRKESGSWKWAAFVIVYTTGIAWLFSFAVYQIGSMFFV